MASPSNVNLNSRPSTFGDISSPKQSTPTTSPYINVFGNEKNTKLTPILELDKKQVQNTETSYDNKLTSIKNPIQQNERLNNLSFKDQIQAFGFTLGAFFQRKGIDDENPSFQKLPPGAQEYIRTIAAQENSSNC